MVVSIGSSTEFYGLDTHTWKQPRENSRTHYVTHTLRTRTGYAHMETQLYSKSLVLSPVSMCVYALRIRVREKNEFLLIFFDCFDVFVIRTGLRDVSVVRETEWLLERFFHALRTLRTAHCTLFSIVMVEFFDVKANI